MRIVENPQLPQNPDTEYARGLNYALTQILRTMAQKLNAIADGRIAGKDLVAASIPTTGKFARGDFITNSSPVEAGTGGSKYVTLGWVCTVGGSPGTLLEVRTLTGN